MLMEYLAHHGILGQKWGVRRYQNADGTWTEAGKKRYSKDIKRDLKRQNREASSAQFKAQQNRGSGAEATSKIYKNQREVLKKIHNELDNSEEKARFNKASEELIKAEEEWVSSKRYDGIVPDYLIKMNDEYEKAASAYNSRREKIWNDNYSDMMGAKLKDIGHEDTKVGRQIVASLLLNDGWYRETNTFR